VAAAAAAVVAQAFPAVEQHHTQGMDGVLPLEEVGDEEAQEDHCQAQADVRLRSVDRQPVGVVVDASYGHWVGVALVAVVAARAAGHAPVLALVGLGVAPVALVLVVLVVLVLVVLVLVVLVVGPSLAPVLVALVAPSAAAAAAALVVVDFAWAANIFVLVVVVAFAIVSCSAAAAVAAVPHVGLAAAAAVAVAWAPSNSHERFDLQPYRLHHCWHPCCHCCRSYADSALGPYWSSPSPKQARTQQVVTQTQLEVPPPQQARA
jgi:uncharacterized membrane protein YccC